MALIALFALFPQLTYGQSLPDGGQENIFYGYGSICTPSCGNITWSTTGVPSGITATISPSVTAWNGQTVLSITVGNNTPPGIYPFGVSTSCSEFVCGGTSIAVVYVTPTGTQQIGKLLGACHPGAPKCAEPIDIGSGNVFEQAVDYQTAGQNTLSFSRYYNSRSYVTSAQVNGAGYFYPLSNWTTNFDRYLYVGSGTVAVQRPDGKTFLFTNSGGSWTTDSDLDYSLTSAAGGAYYLTCPDDSVEYYAPNLTGPQGITYLQQINFRNGYVQSFSYGSVPYNPSDIVLTSVLDSYNRTLTFNYNQNATLASVETPDNTTIDYGYNSSNQLATVTFSTSPTSTITYHYGENSAPATALTSIIDEDGNTYATWTYDANSRGLTNFMGGSGLNANLTTVSYIDSNGSRTVQTGFCPGSNCVTDTYTFVTSQNMPKVSQISRAATSTTAAATENFGYDSNGYLNAMNDWNDGVHPYNQTNYTNNSHGLPTQIVEAAGSSVQRTTGITYDSQNGCPHSPLQETPPAQTINWTYDSGCEPLTVTQIADTTQQVPYPTNGESRTTTFTWSNSLLASMKTGNGNTTTYGYNSNGALTSITDALSHVTTITPSPGGYPETIVDPNSVTTALSYDHRQRLISSEISSNGGNNYTTTYAYDAAGNLTKITRPDNSYITNTYDAAHRLIQATDALGSYVKYTLDALGDATQINTYNSGNYLARQHSGTFDALGRQLTAVGGVGQTTTYTYDPNGNTVSVKDGNGHTTTRTFDALNRISSATDANGGTTNYCFTGLDYLCGIEDANGNWTWYTQDGFNNTIEVNSPDSGAAVYYYDNDNNVTKKVDALSVTTNYAYDALDRITSRTYPADSTQNATFAYDRTGWPNYFGVGRLSSITDAAGVTTYGYEERGYLWGVLRTSGSQSFNVYPTYDGAGRPQGLSYPSGLYVGWNRDAAGNPNQVVIVPPGSQTNQTVLWPAFDPFYGPMHYEAFGNGVTDGIWLDLDYRQTASQVAGTSGNFLYESYTYDNANNLTGVSDSVNSYNNQTLGYDVINRLTSATSGSGGYGSLAWTYDKVGNLLSQTVNSSTTTYGYTSNSNRLASITHGGTINVTTNGNGNITSIPPADNIGAAATFAYSVANRLASVTGTPTTAITSNVYDGLGRRFSKLDSGSSNPIYYTYDPQGHLIEENNNGLVTDYIYMGDTPVGVWLPGTSKLYYTQIDRQGTPIMVTDSNQNVVWSTTYQPYGTTSTIYNSVAQNLRLQGQYADAETGFNYNGFRDYMPNLGRYLEADPIGLAAGMNSYLYANANPNMFTDSSGLRPLTPGEQALAQSVFGNSIDYTQVNVYNSFAYLFQPSNRAMSPDGNIYFPKGDPRYSEDFSKASQDQQCTFIHEMTHVWQHQHGYALRTRRAFCGIFGCKDADYDYTLNSGSDFGDYGLEQQATIVQDYFGLTHFNMVPTYANTYGPPWPNDYSRILPFKK